MLTLSVTVGRSASHLKKFPCSSIIIVYSQLQTIFVKSRYAYAHTRTHKGASFFIRICYGRKAEENGRKTERNGYTFLFIHGRISGHPPPTHTRAHTHTHTHTRTRARARARARKRMDTNVMLMIYIAIVSRYKPILIHR